MGNLILKDAKRHLVISFGELNKEFTHQFTSKTGMLPSWKCSCGFSVERNVGQFECMCD